MPKKIAIIGSVGVPAKYGGFETLVEYLSKHLSSRFDLTVYCSGNSYSDHLKFHNNARLIYIPLQANGIQSIPYDIFSILHALLFADTLLILGVSGCCILPIIRLITKQKIVVNIDGLEWKRNKWNSFAKWFLKYSEKIAVRHADIVVVDNVEILKYVKQAYGKEAVFIPYGGDHASSVKMSTETLERYPFLNRDYAFKVCRIEPENNIEMILEAFSSSSFLQLVLVGNWENSDFGIEMLKKYRSQKQIHLLNPIYNQTILNEMRCASKMYIHGHSAGGTNPSLVEAMSLALPIFAFEINYNEATTANQAFYFKNSSELAYLIEKHKDLDLSSCGQKMHKIASQEYLWSLVAEKYLRILL
jgi:glycosyltransferase involved in cell wall biosynthesis